MNICLSCEGVTATAAERCGHCGVPLLPLESVHYPDRRGEADAGNPLLGSVVDGKFRLEGVLGRGGLGTVFQAVHVGSLMKVALKLLHPRFSERPEYRRALLPEARRAATVTNERCARLLDVGETGDGGTYLAMELVDGATLDAAIREGALMPSHAVDILVQVAEALVAIHAAGLVHCDLSPRNVMVTVRHGALHAKVLDFGIARTASVPTAKELAAGEFSGFANPAFSAPEHLAGRAVDPRADLYSLGALAWLMLTGKAPIDDADPGRAARATIAGELDVWPGVAGVPRRLVRLIGRCLALDPEARPPSAAAVLRELHHVRGARQPFLQRAAVTLLVASVFTAVSASFAGAAPFLEAVGGALPLSALPPEEPRHLTTRDLSRLDFFFGGFAPERLQMHISRGGTVRRRAPLRPEVDAEGTLTLAIEQPEWRSAVQSLLEGSRDGPVDLSFVVPGRALLGSARVRLDDQPPDVEADLVDAAAGELLTAATAIDWRVSDAIALREAWVEVEVAGHGAVSLPLPRGETAGRLALGDELAAALPGAAARGAARVSIAAVDRAGNERTVEVATFRGCDVRAPRVLAVTGPAGEAWLPCVGGVARLRLQLSEAEPGCEVTVADRAERRFLQRALPATGVVHDLEIPLDGGEAGFTTGDYVFVVEDAAGNRSRAVVHCTLRERGVNLQLLPESGLARVGDELVLGRGGAQATVRCSEAYHPVGADVSPVGLAVGPPGGAPRLETRRAGEARLTLPALAPGLYRLELGFEDAVDPALVVREPVTLRVLPDALEVRIARPASRFLPGLVQTGVLQRGATGYREGAGWAYEPELAPYLRGTLWVGLAAEALAQFGLHAASSPSGSLLPEFTPLPGCNVLAVSLRDVLDRPVRVLIGDAPAPRRSEQGRQVDVVAEYWWHDHPPEPIGEELLVEHGQPARLRLRLPLPYEAGDRQLIVLALPQDELAASAVTREGSDGSIASFDLAFDTWSMAAQLRDLPRESYAEQVVRPVSVTVKTPVGDHPLTLSLRTTRSTLRPVGLGELAPLPAALGGLRLVPVLGPDAPFVDPVPLPPDAPSPALFRTQAPVDVRNIPDFLLQDRELTCGEARAIVELGLPRAAGMALRDLVHANDPLGGDRLTASKLLPPSAATAPADRPLTGVDFYQAYTCCRLLGLVVAGDPRLFRLPFGVELELAALGAAAGAACNGPAARGRPIRMADFLAAAQALERGEVADAAESRRIGDWAPTTFPEPITALDFGVREWVLDLPHVQGAEYLLKEWNGDHERNVGRVLALAEGAQEPPPDLAGPLKTYGAVRGLALGETAGLLDQDGRPLDPAASAHVPGTVPGVLRSEQLLRDGRDLLSTGQDPRLRVVGFRVVGTAALVKRLRGLD